MAVFCNFGQPDFVRWLILDGFVRQSKRALTACDGVYVQYLRQVSFAHISFTSFFLKKTPDGSFALVNAPWTLDTFDKNIIPVQSSPPVFER